MGFEVWVKLLSVMNRKDFQSCEISVVDMWGKFQHGILDGNVQSFGDFGRCKEFSHLTNVERIDGRYCTVNYKSNDTSNQVFDFNFGWKEM
jgi:hypothetical protein